MTAAIRDPYDEQELTGVTAGAGVPGDITDPTAVAGQVAWTVRGEIFDGTYPAGSELPSQLDLAGEYGYSEATINRAFAELARQGLISQRSGRRTVVLPHYTYVVKISVTAASGAPGDLKFSELQERLADRADGEPAIAGAVTTLVGQRGMQAVMNVRAANPSQACVTASAILAAAAGTDWDTAHAFVSAEPQPS
jgi:DNA-binding FadR family transcriptional regulator